MLYVCARLISRYALSVYANGDTEITYPFSVVTIRNSELASIVSERHYLEATQSYVTCVRFVDRRGKILASLFADRLFTRNVFTVSNAFGAS